MDGLNPFLDAAAKGGAAMALVFAMLWWMERKERIKAQGQSTKLAIAVLKALNRSTNAIRSMRAVWFKGRDPAPDEYEPEDVAEIISDE